MTKKHMVGTVITVLYAIIFLICLSAYLNALLAKPGEYSSDYKLLMGFVAMVSGIRCLGGVLNYLEGKWVT